MKTENGITKRIEDKSQNIKTQLRQSTQNGNFCRLTVDKGGI